MAVNKGIVEIQEVKSILTAASGVTIAQALADAQIQGANRIEVDPIRNEATITWFKKVEK